MPLRTEWKIVDRSLASKWRAKQASLAGRHLVPVQELFTPRYMLNVANARDFGAFVVDANLRPEIRSVDDMTDEERLEWDFFIRTRTPFPDWSTFFADAGKDWLRRQIEGDDESSVHIKVTSQAVAPEVSPSAEKPNGLSSYRWEATFEPPLFEKLKVLDPQAYEFAQINRIRLERYKEPNGWFGWVIERPREEIRTGPDGQKIIVFFFEPNRTLFEQFESLRQRIRQLPEFRQWLRQQPRPKVAPSISPAPGTPEALQADREAEINYRRKAGATEEEIAQYERDLSANDWFGPGGLLWDAIGTLGARPKAPARAAQHALPARRTQPSPSTAKKEIPKPASISVAEPKGGVYVLIDPDTKEIIRSGRTNDLDRRNYELGRHPELGRFDFEVRHRTDNYAEQRGLEQELDWQYSPRLNKIRAIDVGRKDKVKEYLRSANDYLDRKG
jgi:hypothetical protein